MRAALYRRNARRLYFSETINVQLKEGYTGHQRSESTMAYCPECLTEYSEGSPECIDCHVPLTPGVPPPRHAAGVAPEPNLELETVRIFRGATCALDAELARNVLAEEGIECILPGEGAAEILPGVDLVQLMVRKEEAARAGEILESFLDNAPTLPDQPDDTPGE
jgi:hypothetical protein